MQTHLTSIFHSFFPGMVCCKCPGFKRGVTEPNRYCQARPAVFQALQNRTDIRIIYIEHPSKVLGDDITWNVRKIKAPEVWSRVGFDGSGVVVGVLDNGTDYNHSDLHANIWNNLGEDADRDGHTLEFIEGQWVLDPGDINDDDDDDDNGLVDDLIGWDYHDNDYDPNAEIDGHGTMVAGVIAGDGTGGIQTGITPQAKLMVLRVTGINGETLPSNTILAIEYGFNNNADILNLSIGWRYNIDYTPGGEDDPRADFRYTCDVAFLGGLTICAIAGNEGRFGVPPVPHNIRTPGDVPSVITVGATREDDEILIFSSIGPTTWEDVEGYEDFPYPPGLIKPDVCAPGGTDELEWTPIISTQIGGGYDEDSGTSYAAPAVSGTIALMLQANPLLSPAEIKAHIQQMAIDLGPAGKDSLYGSGRIEAFQSVLMALAAANKTESSKATFSNNSRHLIKGAGYLHEVFSSGGKIFYRRSPNAGQSWDNTLRVSKGNYEGGENGNACISYLETISGETTQKTLFAVWERRISTTQYEVWFSLSNVPDAATLAWSDPELLATVNISSSQSGTMPVISYLDYQGQKRLVVVYCSSQGLKYQFSDDLGSNWSSPTLISSEYPVRYPSLTTNGNLLSLVYDYFNHSNGTYSRVYDGSNWSNETYTSGITGTVYNSTPSVTVDPNGNVLGVWKGHIFEGGEDPYTSIVFRKGFSNNTWDKWFEVFEHEPGISSISPSISFFNDVDDYWIKIVYGNTTDIVKQYVYDGSSWSQPDISFPGRWPNISEESSGSGDPVFFWTNPEGPPYLVELSDGGEESLSKYTPSHANPLENISLTHHRRAVIRDQQSGAFLAVDVEPLIIKNAAGEETALSFKAHSLKRPLNISLQNIGDYLGTDTLGLANDVQNLQLNWSASVFVDEDSSGNANPNIFNGKYQVHLRIKDVNNPAISTTVNITAIPQVNLNIGNFAGRSVVIHPEIHLNNLPVVNLDFGVGNVYSPVSPSQNKVLTQSGSDQEGKVFALQSNYPNPFNPTTTIHYQVAMESKVTLAIYNLLGQKVKTLVNEKIAAGDHYVVWDGRNDHGGIVGSGIYFLKMVAQSGETQFVDTQKLMLMK